MDRALEFVDLREVQRLVAHNRQVRVASYFILCWLILLHHCGSHAAAFLKQPSILRGMETNNRKVQEKASSGAGVIVINR